MTVPGSRRRGVRVSSRVFWIAVAVVVLAGMVKLYGPIATARRQEEELSRLRLEKAALLEDQQRLDAHKRQLACDAGLEATARREGYVRNGERRLVFVRSTGKETPAGDPAPRQKGKPK